MFVSVFVGTFRKIHIIMQRAIKAILLKTCSFSGKGNFTLRYILHLH